MVNPTAATLSSAWNADLVDIFKGKPRPSVLVFPDDLLTMSVTYFRVRSIKTSTPVFFDDGIQDAALVPLITIEDRTRAALIRDHYSKRLMMLVLRGQPLTPYRKKLQEFVNSEVPLTADIIPLVHRLPEFYDYDVGYEEIRTSLTQPTEVTHTDSITATLTPIKHFNVKKKAGGYDEYWLKDDANKGYRIKLPNTPVKNPLISLWEREFSKPSICLVGKRATVSHDGFKFYSMDKWDIV